MVWVGLSPMITDVERVFNYILWKGVYSDPVVTFKLAYYYYFFQLLSRV